MQVSESDAGLFRSVIEGLTQFTLRHLCRGAAMEVNTSAANNNALTQAGADLARLTSAASLAGGSARADTRRLAAAADRLTAALRLVERDVLSTVMRGPVFRFVQRPEYRIWADTIVALFDRIKDDVNSSSPSLA
jgi:hypothetical protein